MNIQNRIRVLMDERGWTEYRLAKESGLAQSTITNMFNRNNAPTFSTLEAICGALVITLVQFFSVGETDNSLTEEQRALFTKWSTLSDEQKKILLDLMNTM